ncbi:hypothetical protein H5410_034565 [Solanum commersonii]|uniref:Uncharacterized protein n=1 Tax=Solanum commersonii TaxID=4109 RepID=A0A9J5YR02_SOLCO|nr:hypothetical protein H5410_034565 [Solanum commersonii]
MSCQLGESETFRVSNKVRNCNQLLLEMQLEERCTMSKENRKKKVKGDILLRSKREDQDEADFVASAIILEI